MFWSRCCYVSLRLVQAGWWQQVAGLVPSTHWTLAWKSKLVFNQQGERETKTDPRFTLYISRMMRTQNPVHVRRVRQIYTENFIRQVTRQLQEKITVCSLFFPFTPHTPFYYPTQHLVVMTFSSNISNNSNVNAIIMSWSHVDWSSDTIFLAANVNIGQLVTHNWRYK